MEFDELNSTEWVEMAKFIAGEMDIDETLKYEERINSSGENKKLVEQLKSNWGKMENYRKQNTFDTDKAWNKLHTKFENEGLIVNRAPGNKFKISSLLKIAAIFILGILLSSVIYYLQNDSSKAAWQVAETYKNTEIRKIELPDHSVVYLNANSKLYYPDKFSEKNRIVEFEGDAFFEITKNPDSPFVIKARNAEIKVLGTSFNVNTNVGTDEVEVHVKTGKVKLSSNQNMDSSVFLEPGFMGKLQKNSVSKQINTDKNYLSWKTKYFDFKDGVKLGKAIEILNRAYHVNIICTDKLVCETILYTTFDNQPLDTILNIICAANYFKMKEENDKIILTK